MIKPAILLTVLLLAAACAKKTAYEPWCNDWQILVRDAQTEAGKVSNSYEGAWREGEMTPDKYGNRPYFDYVGAHVGILELHPVSHNEPAKLKYTGSISTQTPVLSVIAGGNIHGDCLLQLYVNGAKTGEYVLNGGSWTQCKFDLSNFAGQGVDLQLWVTPGGEERWKFEHCFIDEISFLESRRL
jgi:hypothetical protein